MRLAIAAKIHIHHSAIRTLLYLWEWNCKSDSALPEMNTAPICCRVKPQLDTTLVPMES